jgi:hypothetical protein
MGFQPSFGELFAHNPATGSLSAQGSQIEV